MASNEYISKEIQASQYYVHRSFVNSYYYVYKFVEKWVAENIFRQDSSRIFLASNDYAFRRRFELTDTSKDYSELECSALRFPFANYWPQNSGWIIDPRIAAKSAVLTYIGIYEGNTQLRAAQSLFNIPITFWFDREDDARLAYEILYFNSYNEHYYDADVPYGRDNTLEDSKGYVSNILKLPMNLEIENLKFNPEFNESNWLKEQRIFVITTDFRVRSYAITPPKQPKYDLTVDGTTGLLSDGSDYEDGINYFYIVDDVISNFSQSEKGVLTFDADFDVTTQKSSGSTPFPEEGEVGIIYVDSHKKEISPYDLNIYIWNYLTNKYEVPDYELDSLSIRESGTYEESKLNITRFDCISNITQTSNLIEWAYGDDTLGRNTYDSLMEVTKNYSSTSTYAKGDYCIKDSSLYRCLVNITTPETWNDNNWIEVDTIIEEIEFHLTGNSEYIEIDSGATSYKLSKLKAGSQYYGYFVFKSTSGISKKFIVSFTTKESKKSKDNTLNSLIGVSW